MHNAVKPAVISQTCRSCALGRIASLTIRAAMTSGVIPLARPDRISVRLRPYVSPPFGGLAARPTTWMGDIAHWARAGRLC